MAAEMPRPATTNPVWLAALPDDTWPAWLTACLAIYGSPLVTGDAIAPARLLLGAAIGIHVAARRRGL